MEKFVINKVSCFIKTNGVVLGTEIAMHCLDAPFLIPVFGVCAEQPSTKKPGATVNLGH